MTTSPEVGASGSGVENGKANGDGLAETGQEASPGGEKEGEAIDILFSYFGENLLCTFNNQVRAVDMFCLIFFIHQLYPASPHLLR